MFRSLVCLGCLRVVSSKIFFQETFDEGWEKRWTPSKVRESEGLQGTFKTATGKWYVDEKEDRGLQTAKNHKYFGLAASFDSFSNDGMELIIQYQVKFEQNIECGGAYLKIGPKVDDLTLFGEPTPYNIMFGPDRCGGSKKTHLIFNYKGKNVLKKENLVFKQESYGYGITHLYRMVLKPDNTVRVEIDDVNVYEGSLKEDWELLEPKEIPDPEDKKPEDWVDDKYMDDPGESKPSFWNDQKRIVDTNAVKPHDWDYEEDGVWEAPVRDNPEYMGEWKARRIVNPGFKGFWDGKKIPNPAFKDDDNLYRHADFGFIGFDLWQVRGGVIFDNIIVTDDKSEADAFAKKWKRLYDFEFSQFQREHDS